MSHCIICNKGGFLSNVFEKGENFIIQASKERQDEVHEVIAQQLSVNSPMMIHENCRRDYTASSNIAKIVKKMQRNWKNRPVVQHADMFQIRMTIRPTVSSAGRGRIQKNIGGTKDLFTCLQGRNGRHITKR